MIELIVLLMLISITLGLIMLSLVALNMLDPRMENPARLALAFFFVVLILELGTLYLIA